VICPIHHALAGPMTRRAVDRLNRNVSAKLFLAYRTQHESCPQSAMASSVHDRPSPEPGRPLFLKIDVLLTDHRSRSDTYPDQRRFVPESILILGPIRRNGFETTLGDPRLPWAVETNNVAPVRGGVRNVRWGEETVYGHMDLGQDTERGTDPGALFPPKLEVGSRSEGSEGYPACNNKVNEITIDVLRIDAYAHLFYGGEVVEGFEKM
jgi:hypothetical protein